MDYDNKPTGYYDNVRYEMLRYVKGYPKTIIDIGCGQGAFATILKEKTNAEVWGVEYMHQHAEEAKKVLDKVFSGPIEDHMDSLPNNFFEVAYFNDVLEHLVDPYKVLMDFKKKMAPGGIIISSIPNIRYHNSLSRFLLKKDWQYEDHGVMDKTHLRFFTNKSIKRMYEDAGYEVLVHEGINKSRSLKPILYNIPLLFSQMDIFYPQYATVARVRK